MMVLYVDNVACEVEPVAVDVAIDSSKLHDVAKWQSGRSQKVVVCDTPVARGLFGGDRHLNSAVKFNLARHTGALVVDGSVLMSGSLRLLGCGAHGFTVELREGGVDWVKWGLRSMLNGADIDYNADLTQPTIVDSWSEGGDVVFLPTLRESYELGYDNPQNGMSLPILTVNDCHPFLKISSILQALTDDHYYDIESRFLESDLGQSLYMSGNYSSQQNDALENSIGFCARRVYSHVAVADEYGVVHMKSGVAANDLGAIANCTSQSDYDKIVNDGKGVYNNSNCYSIRDEVAYYTPSKAVEVAFDYHIRYLTQHKIVSSTKLKGFDTIYFDGMGEIKFDLVNNYVDRRDEGVGQRLYTAMIFGAYFSRARIKIISKATNKVAGVVDYVGKSTKVTTPNDSREYRFEVEQYSLSQTWVAYGGDWAIYDGHVEEMGSTVVELNFSTPAYSLSESNGFSFATQWFKGAEEGMSIQLARECCVRSNFRSSVGYGSPIQYRDVAQHQVSQVAVVEALQHMYDLVIYTDEIDQKVYVEPHDQFFECREEDVVDWSARIDYSQPLEIEDCAIDSFASTHLGYQEGDSVVKRYDKDLGNLSVVCSSYGSKMGVDHDTNPLFAPTFSQCGLLPSMEGVPLMNLCDPDNLRYDISPRVVSYRGLKPMPDGQRWLYGGSSSLYPLAGFYSDVEGEEFTLGFEDRDGCEGLGHYHATRLEESHTSQYFTLYLTLRAKDIEPLTHLSSMMPTLRSIYRFAIDGAVVWGRLDRIETFDPSARSTKCRFIKINPCNYLK